MIREVREGGQCPSPPAGGAADQQELKSEGACKQYGWCWYQQGFYSERGRNHH